MAKRKIFISNHGIFEQFGLKISLPAIIELTEEQIEFINNSGLYKVDELTSRQMEAPKDLELDIVDGDRFSRKRSISVNELAFKAPIMATAYAKDARGAIVVKKGSIYEKQALEQLKQTKELKHSKKSESSSNVGVPSKPIKTEKVKGTKKDKDEELVNSNLFNTTEVISTDKPKETE